MVDQGDSADGNQVVPFLQAVLDSLSAHIVILDDQAIIRAVNVPWRRFADDNGLSWADYGIGRNYLGAFAGAQGEGVEDARAASEGIRAVMNGTQDQFRYEYPCDSPDERRWYMMWATPVVYGGTRGVVIAHEDITARRLSEEQAVAARLEAEQARAAESKQRLLSERRGAIAAALKDVLAVLNSDLPVERVLATIVDRARTLLGASSVAIVPVAGDDRGMRSGAQEPGPLDKGLSGDSFVEALLALGMPTGYVAVEDAGAHLDPQRQQKGPRLMAPIRVEGSDYAVLIVTYDEPRSFVQDEVDLVSDLALQTALSVENSRLQLRIQSSAVESERTRLLRELHDSVSQSLFSANLIADSLPRVWETHPQEARQGLEEIQRLTRSALLEMRGLLLDLGPMALSEHGLDLLLARLTASLATRSQITIRLDLDARVTLPQKVKVAFYRVAEEALNNAVKHSHANGIEVTLRANDARAELCIRDDGCGFLPDLVSAGHLGLDIMRGRAHDIGATLTIHSSPQSGTEVILSWDGLIEVAL